MDIFQILYIGFILFSIPVFVIVALKLIQSYRKSGHKQSFSFAIFSLFAALGITALMIEQVILAMNFDNVVELNLVKNTNFEATLARIIVISAVGFSCVCMIALGYFGLSFLDQKYMKLIYPLTLVVIIYLLLYAFLPFEWVEEVGVIDYSHEENDMLLLLIFLIPTWFSFFILSYATIISRQMEGYIIKRSLLLTIGQFIISITYTIQIISPNILTAMGFFYYPIHMYVVFTQPKWFKKIIGAPI